MLSSSRLSLGYSVNSDSSNDDDDNSSESSENEQQDIYKTITRNHFLLILGKDRSYTNGETNFSFNVDFTSNYITNYKNIRSVKILYVFIPDLYTDIKSVHGLINDTLITSSSSADSNNIRLNRIKDYDFITMNIDFIGSCVDSTNNIFSNASFILYPEDFKRNTTNNSGRYEPNSSMNNYEVGNVGNSLIAGTSKGLIYFKNLSAFDKIYYPATKASIPSMKFSFYSPYGELLSLMDDYLTVERISVAVDGSNNITVLKIRMTEYFSPEEYKIGDKININSISIGGAGTITAFDSDTPAVNGAWQVNQTAVSASAFTTSGSGEKLVLSITTDPSSGAITGSSITDGGIKFAASDTIVVTDPGNTSNTATFTVSAVTSSTTLYKDSLEAFLNRASGHSILGLESSISSNSSKLYNIIKIPFDYTINKTTCAVSKSTFNIEYTSQYYVSSGTLLNLNNQVSIGMKIDTEIRENVIIATRLI